MTRQTSIEAYRTIQDEGLLTKSRLVIYKNLFVRGPCTASQLHQSLGWRVKGSISARLTELVQMGVVTEVTEAKCPISNQTVIFFDVTDKLPVKMKKDKTLTLRQAKQRMDRALLLLEEKTDDFSKMILEILRGEK